MLLVFLLHRASNLTDSCVFAPEFVAHCLLAARFHPCSVLELDRSVRIN